MITEDITGVILLAVRELRKKRREKIMFIINRKRKRDTIIVIIESNFLPDDAWICRI